MFARQHSRREQNRKQKVRQRDRKETAMFLQGMRDGTPFGISFFFLFFAIGAAYRTAGLDSIVATVATALIFSAPSQLATMDFLSDGAWGSLLLATAVINSRLTFMAATLLPYFREQKRSTLAIAAQVLSTSAFALTFAHCKNHPTPNAFSYFLGTALVCFPISIIGTYVGATFAENISDNYMSILRMVLPVYFIHLLARSWPQRKPLLAGFLGFILAPTMEHMFPNGGLMAGSIVGGLVVLFAEKRRNKVTNGL